MTQLFSADQTTDELEPMTGELDLEDRRALRRVAGMSTELTDVTEVEYRALRLERVVLVGVWTEGTAEAAENSLRELALLAETAGSQVLDGVIQRRDKPDAATYIGSGKAQELRDIVASTGADTVVCDGELTPGQLIHLVPTSLVRQPREQVTMQAPSRPGPAVLVPAASTSPLLSDDELLDEIEAAVQLRRAQSLRALDALTPTASEFRDWSLGR